MKSRIISLASKNSGQASPREAVGWRLSTSLRRSLAEHLESRHETLIVVRNMLNEILNLINGSVAQFQCRNDDQKVLRVAATHARTVEKLQVAQARIELHRMKLQTARQKVWVMSNLDDVELFVDDIERIDSFSAETRKMLDDLNSVELASLERDLESEAAQ